MVADARRNAAFRAGIRAAVASVLEGKRTGPQRPGAAAGCAVLDFGTGSGLLALYACEAGATAVVGVDTSARTSSRARGRSRARRRTPPRWFVHKDCRRLEAGRDFGDRAGRARDGAVRLRAAGRGCLHFAPRVGALPPRGREDGAARRGAPGGARRARRGGDGRRPGRALPRDPALPAGLPRPPAGRRRTGGCRRRSTSSTSTSRGRARSPAGPRGRRRGDVEVGDGPAERRGLRRPGPRRRRRPRDGPRRRGRAGSRPASRSRRFPSSKDAPGPAGDAPGLAVHVLGRPRARAAARTGVGFTTTTTSRSTTSSRRGGAAREDRRLLGRGRAVRRPPAPRSASRSTPRASARGGRHVDPGVANGRLDVQPGAEGGSSPLLLA